MVVSLSTFRKVLFAFLSLLLKRQRCLHAFRAASHFDLVVGFRVDFFLLLHSVFVWSSRAAERIPAGFVTVQLLASSQIQREIDTTFNADGISKVLCKWPRFDEWNSNETEKFG